MHTLSIIIPVLNEADQAAGILPGLQAARQHGHEVIVVDGGSEDNSVDMFTACADKIITAPQGRAVQMNAGAAIADGDALLFLHADTLLVDDFDQLLLAALQRSVWGFFLVRLSGQHCVFRLIEAGMNCRSFLTAVATGDQCLFVRRATFLALHGYAEIALMEDIDLCRRLRALQRPAIIRQPVITSSRRWEERGIFRTILNMWWLRLAWYLGRDPAALARQYD